MRQSAASPPGLRRPPEGQEQQARTCSSQQLSDFGFRQIPPNQPVADDHGRYSGYSKLHAVLEVSGHGCGRLVARKTGPKARQVSHAYPVRDRNEVRKTLEGPILKKRGMDFLRRTVVVLPTSVLSPQAPFFRLIRATSVPLRIRERQLHST